jgi:hypothetical protein
MSKTAKILALLAACVIVAVAGYRFPKHRSVPPVPRESLSPSTSVSKAPAAPVVPLVTTDTSYTNARYGFSVKYPGAFKRDPPVENGDGMGCTSGDGFHMLVYGSNNVFGSDLDTLMTEQAEGFTKVSYQKQGKNWFVLSGTKGATIFYVKVYVGKGATNTLEIEYPAALKKKYDPVVTAVVGSFKAGELQKSQ